MTLSLADITSALHALGQDDFTGLQLLDAATVARQHYPRLDPAQPALLLGLAEPATAQRLAAALLQAYPPEHAVTVLVLAPHVVDNIPDTRFGAQAEQPANLEGGWRTASNPVHQQRAIPLGQLAQAADLGPLTHLYLPPRAGAATYEALQDVVAQLRAPDGCPWDRALTWSKLRASLLEECYELLAALDAGEAAKVAEEGGDLLLQIALQTQIAAEEGRYRLPDVIARIVEKLIRRHPHVFGDAVVSSEAEVLANWEAIKAAERARNGEKRSPLAGVPAGLPALAQAEAYLDRMSRLRPAEAPEAPWAPLAALDPDAPLDAETLGNALFNLVAWSLARGVEAESALRQANARYASGIEASAGPAHAATTG